MYMRVKQDKLLVYIQHACLCPLLVPPTPNALGELMERLSKISGQREKNIFILRVIRWYHSDRYR